MHQREVKFVLTGSFIYLFIIIIIIVIIISSSSSSYNKINNYHNYCYHYYYSFKIFLRFWLAKIPRIIHHNQLLSTKFGRIWRYVKNDVNCAEQNCQITEQLTEKTWGRSWVVLWVSTKYGTFHSFHQKEIGELLAKIIARTAKRKLN